MVDKLIIAFLCMALSCTALTGCEKRTSTPAPQKSEVKTISEYRQQTESEVNKENMAAELNKIEKEIEAETVAENP